MKNTISILLSCFIALAHAQSEKLTVAPFSSSAEYEQHKQDIYDNVLRAFVKSGRFIVIEHSVWSKSATSPNHELLSEKVIEEAKAHGIKFIVSGNISSIFTYADTIKVKGQKPRCGYKARISVALRILNSETGQILVDDVLQGATSIFSVEMTPAEAIIQAKGNLTFRTKNWIEKTFGKI